VPLPKSEKSIFETILARRSVRRFKSKKVDRSTIRNLLEAAVMAPTAIHQEPWAFIIIQDKNMLKDLSELAKPVFLANIHQHRSEHPDDKLDKLDKLDIPDSPDSPDSPDFNIFYNASTLIVICGKTSSPFFIADCWLAAENLMLAACAMDLGTCVIGSAIPAFNVPEVRAKLKIPDGFSVVAPIILGYPDEDISPNFRKSPVVFSNISAP
jgi:nitroreductase